MPLRILCLVPLLLCLLVPAPARAGQVNAFIYHRFDEFRYPSTNIAVAVFRQQLEYLKQRQIAVLPLQEVVTRLQQHTVLPERAVVLTVDDAFTSFYKAAMPVIEEYGYPVTLFVNSDAVGSNGYMTWEQLREVQTKGITIGNHSATHDYLVERQAGEDFAMWQERVTQDIAEAERALKEHLGTDATLFAYPFGEFNHPLMDIVRKQGFSAAIGQQSGVMHDHSDLYCLPRFPMGGAFATLDGFISKLQMKPLVVTAQAGDDPVITGHNPPVLQLKIPGLANFSAAVNCFVQGDNRCTLVRDEKLGADWYRVTAEHALTGRRNKYTLTGRDSDGRWFWFSQPWVLAKNPALK